MKKKFLAAFLTLCMVISSLPVMATAADFKDVDGHWGKASIDRWASVGVLNGDNNGNFNPDKQMTRAEFATMLANMMGYTEKASNSFGDVAADAWYADAILKLAAAGVMLGDNNGNANPNKSISRAEASVMLCRAFKIPTSNASLNFADSADVADWARGSMAALAERGMINGVGNNQLAPRANITRASVAKLVDNMIAEYVTSSKTITGEVKGIVLVASNADVTIENATLTAPVIIAPKASNAAVTLSGTTKADSVIAASSATINVDKDAVVNEITLEAPKATVNVSGTVSSVTVAENADNASIVANKDAKIDNVTTAAENVSVSGTGTVGTVTATGGSAAVTVQGANVINQGADKVTAGSKPVEQGKTEVVEKPAPSGSGGGGGGGSSRPTTYSISVTPNEKCGIEVSESSAAAGTQVTISLTSQFGYSVKSVTVQGSTANNATVQLTGRNGYYTFIMPSENVTVSVEILQNADIGSGEQPGGNCYLPNGDCNWIPEDTSGDILTDPKGNCVNVDGNIIDAQGNCVYPSYNNGEEIFQGSGTTETPGEPAGPTDNSNKDPDESSDLEESDAEESAA